MYETDETENKNDRLDQRMRDLYDFDTDTEWPRRLAKRNSTYDEEIKYSRRNSQELEFNERIGVDCCEYSQDERRNSRTTMPNYNHRYSINSYDEEQRMRIFNEKLRYSEDLGTNSKLRFNERRMYSSDRDSISHYPQHQQPRRSVDEYRIYRENKRNSNVSMKSRPSYAEIDFVKRNSGISDASYVSILSHHNDKRGSLEYKGTRIVEVPLRRAVSQSTERPPIETNHDTSADDSSRYKVYLT